MSGYRDKKVIGIECPLCQGPVYIYIFGDHHDDSKLRCDNCGLENSGYFYHPHMDLDCYAQWWIKLRDVIISFPVKPCIFCSLETTPWHTKCSQCFLKDRMLEYVLNCYEDSESTRQKLLGA